MNKPKHWAVLPLIELEDVAKALCSWKKKKQQQRESGAPETCIFYCGTNATVDIMVHQLTLGYLILMDICKESDKDKVLL